MTQLVLVLLGVVWIVVLVPDVARLFKPRQRAFTSVDQFRRQLDSLGRSAPAAVQISAEYARRRRGEGRRRTHPPTSMPETPNQAALRRRNVGRLLALCTLAAFAGAAVTGSLWTRAAFAVLLLVSVTFALLALRRRRAAPRAQVHYLPVRAAAMTSTVNMVRRTANE